MIAHPWRERLRAADLVQRRGKVRRLRSTFIEADGPAVPLGTLCHVVRRGAGTPPVMAEVIGVDPKSITLAPFDQLAGTEPGAEVIALSTRDEVPAGDAFLGRVVDSLGRPVDGKPVRGTAARARLYPSGPAPLERAPPAEPLQTGIRAIDGLLTFARGQRVGVFAAAGVGKTSLIHQLARQVDADRIVVALVGERGREVDGLWSDLPAEVRKRAVLVAATSDQSAVLRARAAYQAMALAEYWRDQGHNVLLLVDSVTRLAMALREIGLAAGEPPTVRAYTPNVFAALPRLVERAGAVRGGGSISAIMTILAESDELDDPICEMMKSLLDGHILLTRSLAEQGHFPAIDVSRSVSRHASAVSSARALGHARTVTAWLSAFEETRTIRQAGLYAPGADAQVDRALERYPELIRFLRQAPDVKVPLGETLDALAGLAEGAS
jgi:flagellum-specific ATP synthase